MLIELVDTDFVLLAARSRLLCLLPKAERDPNVSTRSQVSTTRPPSATTERGGIRVAMSPEEAFRGLGDGYQGRGWGDGGSDIGGDSDVAGGDSGVAGGDSDGVGGGSNGGGRRLGGGAEGDEGRDGNISMGGGGSGIGGGQGCGIHGGGSSGGLGVALRLTSRISVDGSADRIPRATSSGEVWSDCKMPRVSTPSLATISAK